MKPETAGKHFIDPFRYWHPVTNNDVQKLKDLLVWSRSCSKVYSWRKSSRIQPTEQALLCCFSLHFSFFFFFFFDCLHLERSRLAADKFYK